MPGVQVFTRLALAKETVKGTPLAPTRRFYGTVAGNFDIGDTWAYHEAENRGLRTRPSRTPTQLAEDPKYKIVATDGIGYDDLVQPFSMGLRGGQTGTGAGADKTWTFAAQNTGSNAYESMSADVGDDTQNWRLQYVQPTRWMLGAQLTNLTSFEADCFAQRAIKTAPATPAEVSPVKIAGELWTVKFATTFAGLAGASVSTNFLRAWTFEYLTGLVPRHYQDGTLYMAQSVETDLAGNLHLEVESTALAVSELVDKYRAGTTDFVRLKATGPTLGSTNYSLQLDIPVQWGEPKVIASEDSGVNIYTVDGHLVYDPTSAGSLVATLVCSLATIP